MICSRPPCASKRADDVTTAFHARYDVLRKTYRYRILMTPVCSPLLWRFVCHHPYPLNRARMAEAAGYFEGEHDFTSFAAADGQEDEPGNSNLRVVHRSRLLWRPRSSMLVYDVTGKGFLRYMVRNMVGTLLEVGRGKLSPRDIPSILAACDRNRPAQLPPPRAFA